MRSVTVDKADLIATIQKNRDDHYDQFLRAQQKYRERVIELLDERLTRARNGQMEQVLVLSLPEPQNYTSSYDTALAMLDWEQGDSVKLERDDFERYVLNKWEWARAFAGTTQAYLAEEE